MKILMKMKKSSNDFLNKMFVFVFVLFFRCFPSVPSAPLPPSSGGGEVIQFIMKLRCFDYFNVECRSLHGPPGSPVHRLVCVWVVRGL